MLGRTQRYHREATILKRTPMPHEQKDESEYQKWHVIETQSSTTRADNNVNQDKAEEEKAQKK